MKKFRSFLRKKNVPILFVFILAFIGAALLIVSLAAVPSYNLESENGTLSGIAAINDSAASGGKAIQFKATVSTVCTPTTAPGTGTGPTNPMPCRYGLSNGPSGTWNLDWHDEFDGSSLDLSKWRPNYLAGTDTAITKPSNSIMQNCEDPAQTSVSGGRIRLTLVQRNCTANNGVTYPYASGYASTHADKVLTGSFYIETQMFMPPITGGTAGPSACANWPGIWTNGVASGVSWPAFLENDVMECLEGTPAANVHAGPTGGDDSWRKTIGNIGNKSGWHVFAASLVRSNKSCASTTPDSAVLTYYYDGVQLGLPYETCYKNTGQFIMLQNDIQANSAKNTLPSTTEFDYVRVWTRP